MKDKNRSLLSPISDNSRKEIKLSKIALLHILQRGYDSLPTEFIDIYRGKTFFTQIPLKPQTIGYNARLLTGMIKGVLMYEIIDNGLSIRNDAKESLIAILIDQEPPATDSFHLYLTMTMIILSSSVYYGIIKPNDIRYEINKERIHRDR